MTAYERPRVWEQPLGRVGRVEVSRYETPTGVRLALRSHTRAFRDPLELEGLTRVRYKPIPILPGGDGEQGIDPAQAWAAYADRSERLQNEFALVAVAVVRWEGKEGLLVRDMNGGLAVVLRPEELEALLRARHMDFAPLVDTSDLVALLEPDIDEV